MARMVLGTMVAMAAASMVTTSSAAELVVYDETFDFDETEHGFHYYQPPPGAPADWSSPDDYYNGTWEMRFEIFDQATNRASKLQTCIWVTGGNETCSPHTPVEGPGNVATSSTSPSTWWTKSGPVDFAHPEIWDRLGMPLWNDETCVVSDWDNSFCWEDRGDYFPMRIRLTVVAVSAGSTFSGWDSYILSPTVQFTEPTDGALLVSGSSIHLEATAEASYAAIGQVDFLEGTTLLGSATSAPYAFDWEKAADGEHSLIARAIDTFDATAEDLITVTVGTGGGGTGGSGTGGSTSSGGLGGGGSGPTPAAGDGDSGDGCGCRMVGGRTGWPMAALALAPWLVLPLRRRRRS